MHQIFLMFSVSNISVYYPGNELLNSISFNINPRDKIGLVGRNGSGKTTLLNIIAGEKRPDQGQISIPSDKRIGYLKQEINIDPLLTVFEKAMMAFSEINSLENEIQQITEQIERISDHSDPGYLLKINILHEKHERLNYLEAASRGAHVEKILKGLGFKTSDFTRKLGEFSGGWQMRVELTKILLLKPDLVLLDEPTNHLDIESILWFEDYLTNYPSAVILISHDKKFLDNVCSRTIEIINSRIYDYKVNYSGFLKLRDERLETQKNAAKNQQRYIEQQERFIERFRAKNTKAKQVRSKLKKLEKIERIEFDETDSSSIQFRFPAAPRSGNVIFEGKNLSKNYGNISVLKNLDFDILRGDRIAFVGKNGEGKTTLIKILMNLVDFDGSLKPGYNLNIGYYAQVQEQTLKEELTVYDTIANQATGDWTNTTRLRTLLGVFLFSDDDVEKKVKVLSGGEKSRLALATLLLKPYNVLILDEPTNHLDIPSKQVLKTALLDFNGTLILVSHDRDFLDGLTNRTFEFSGGNIVEYIGGIKEFLYAHKVESFREFEVSGKNNFSKTQKNDKTEHSFTKEKFQQRKDTERELRKLKNAMQRCEQQIEKNDQLLKELELKMQEPDFYKNHLNVKTILSKHEQIKMNNHTLLEEWEKLNDEIIQIKDKQV